MKNKRKGFTPGKRAIVLLSGGLDSATTLYYAKRNGFDPYCLVFDYGQKHQREITAAQGIARALKAPLERIKISFPWKGSSLLDTNKKIPHVSFGTRRVSKSIPNTYVPARNIVFLSFALSYAEVIGAEAIFIGAHAQDYSGYPDCRP
jgi:7-cyano-7-deazaguanine synthase